MAYSTRASKRGLSGGKVLEAGPRAEVTTGKFICEGAEVTYFVTGRTPLSQFHPQTKISWVEQCSALVCGQRSTTMGRGVDELDMQMSISDLVELGALRRVSGKSLDVPAQLAPLNSISSTWSNRKMILANTVHVRFGFVSRPWYRPQNIHDDLKEGLRKFVEAINCLNTPFLSLLEAYLLLSLDLRLAQSKAHKMIAFTRFLAHGRGGTLTFNTLFSAGMLIALSSDLVEYFTTDPEPVNEPQSLLSTLESGMDLLSSGLDNIDKLWQSPVAQTLRSLITVTLAMFFFREEGVKPEDVTKEEINRLRDALKTRQWYFTDNPLEFLARSVLFIGRAVITSLKNKSWIGLLGDESNVTSWALEAGRLTSLATNLATLEAHGTTFHQFSADLDKAIAQGDIHVRTTDGFMRKECFQTLSKLRLLRNDTIARGIASKMRDPPFAALFAGGTSIGKSSLIDMFYQFYGKTVGLEATDEYKYPRNSGEDHWNNFRSSQWCIQFDEIAPLRPEFSKEVDPTTKDVLGVCNPMPFSPPQASLDDKGKTPCLAKLVLGSTNVMDLNAPVYFENPTAVLRRFHIIVEVRVRSAFAKQGGMLDFTRTNPAAFADYWEIVVWKAVPVPRKGTNGREQMLRFELEHQFDNIGKFLEYSRKKILDHQRECATMRTSMKNFKDVDLCPTCGVFQPVCVCPENADTYCAKCDGLCRCVPDVETDFEAEFYAEFPEFKVEEEEQDFAPFFGPRRMPNPTFALNLMRRARAHGPEYSKTLWNLIRDQFLPVEGQRLQPQALTASDVVTAPFPEDWLRYREYTNMSWLRAFKKFGIGKTLSYFGRTCRLKLVPLGIGFVASAWLFRNRTYDFALYCFVNGLDDITRWSKSKKIIALLSSLTVMGAGAYLWYRSRHPTPIGVLQTGVVDAIKNSPSNQEVVWHKDDYRTCWTDVGRMSCNWSQMKREEIVRRLENNIARIRAGTRQGHAFCVGGNLWVTNAHFFYANEDSVKIDFHFDGGKGVSQDVVQLEVRKSCRIHSDETDTVYMWLPTMTPRKNVIPLLPHKTLKGIHNGFSMSRGFVPDTSLHIESFTSASLKRLQVMDTNRYLFQWQATVERDTKLGDCGSIAISMSHFGPIILGFHSLGQGKQACFQPLWSDEVTAVTQQFVPYLLDGGRMMMPENSPPLVRTIHPKSPISFLEEGSCIPIGTFLGARAEPKTRVRDSKLRVELERRGWECDFHPPAMKGWLPKRNAIKDVLSPHSPFDPILLRQTAEEAVVDIMRLLPPTWKDELGFVPLDVALNGIPGVAHMDRLNVSTSCGFPYKGPKKQFLTDDIGDMSGVLTADPEIVKQVDQILESWRRGEQAGVVITAALKDEPRSAEKVANSNTRMFQVAPMAFTIALRMVMLPLLRLFYVSHEAFCSAPGVDAGSGEWDQLFGWLNEFENAIDGDFKKFDTLLRGDVMHAVWWIIHRIADESGKYTPTQLNILYAAVMECCYVIVNFFGDVIQLFGINSSGNAATVFFNCLANLIILRYVYAKLHPDGNSVDFLVYVRLILYGDDNLSTVSEDRPWFNFATIQAELAKLGITYTPARKTEDTYEYKALSDTEFLKRTFKYNSELGHFMGALNVASIEKMTMVMIPSSSVPEDVQTVDMVSSAVREAFLHGREYFDQCCGDLQAAIVTAGITEVPSYVFPTYEELVEKYVSKSESRDFFRGSPEPNRYKIKVRGASASVTMCESASNQNSTEESSYCESDGQPNLSVDSLSNEPGRSPNTLFRVGEGTTPNSPPPPVSVASRGGELNNHANNFYSFQTLEEDNLVEKTLAETTHFTSASAGDVDGFKASPSVPTFGSAELGKFLSRPVQIGYLLWTPSTPDAGAMTIYPWQAFFNNAYIKQKVSNFGLIRGNLKVKVLVNATPFVYGSALISYWPLCGLNEDRTAGPNREVSRSQRPSIWVDPSGSRGGELHLPFFTPRDWLELGSDYGMKSMGRLDFDVVAPLQSATSSSSIDCSIQVYAWLEDVELAAPTVGSLLALQTKDEFSGTVSGPASAVAAVAGKLSKLPIIGKAATAAEIGSSAIARLSSLFGYSNVTDLDGPASAYLAGFPAMSTVGQSHPVNVLAMDPKNGLGISATTVGLDQEDQTSVSGIATRESYLGQFLWDPSQATDTLLFSGRISPNMFAIRDVGPISNPGAAREIYMSPMCMVSRMFRFWRGDIVLRFRFVCSPYHRGRLIISYDPTGDVVSNLVNKTDTTAVVQTYIVDLATLGDTADFEVTIPYSQASPWCQCNPRMDPTDEWSIFGSPVFFRQAEVDNGTVTVRIQTELSSPSGAGTVPILVFAHGAENLEFAAPGIDNGQQLSYFRPQVLDTEVIENHTTPDISYLLNMGEKVVDLRSLLQRRTRMITQATKFVGSSAWERLEAKLSRTPLQYGYDPEGWYVGQSVLGLVPTTANFVPRNFLSWMWPHYAAHRGAMEYTVNWDSDNGMTYTVGRSSSEEVPGWGYTSVPSTASDATVAEYLNSDDAGSGGFAVTNTRYQPTTTVSLPMYHYNKFYPNNIAFGTTNEVLHSDWAVNPTGENYTSAHLDMRIDKLKIQASKSYPASLIRGKINVFIAAGNDFNFLWFTGCAPVWEYDVIPV